MDEVCEIAACCENGGSFGECLGYSYTPEITYMPTSSPLDGDDGSSTTGPPSDAAKLPIAANAFLWSFAVVTGVIPNFV